MILRVQIRLSFVSSESATMDIPFNGLVIGVLVTASLVGGGCFYLTGITRLLMLMPTRTPTRTPTPTKKKKIEKKFFEKKKFEKKNFEKKNFEKKICKKI